MLYWISFIDEEKPKGQAFIGVAIVRAPSIDDAIKESHRLGVNPGGQAMVIRVPELYAGYTNRLMSKEEIAKMEIVVRGGCN